MTAIRLRQQAAYRFDAHELDTFDLPPQQSVVQQKSSIRSSQQASQSKGGTRAYDASVAQRAAVQSSGLESMLRNALNIAAPLKHIELQPAPVGPETDDIQQHGDRSEEHHYPESLDAVSAQLRTGEDAINSFAQHGASSTIKFVHLVRADTGKAFRPYDLLVQNPRDCGPDYFTMSSSGLVHVCPGQPSEFIPLSTWMQQATMFNMLRSLRFFKHYLPAKSFALWRNNVRFKLYSQQRRKAAQNLFLAKESFAAPLLELKRHVQDIQVRLDDAQSVSTCIFVKARFMLKEEVDSRQSMPGKWVVHPCCWSSDARCVTAAATNRMSS